jgi:hypothetical protein
MTVSPKKLGEGPLDIPALAFVVDKDRVGRILILLCIFAAFIVSLWLIAA